MKHYLKEINEIYLKKSFKNSAHSLGFCLSSLGGRASIYSTRTSHFETHLFLFNNIKYFPVTFAPRPILCNFNVGLM